MSRETLKDMLVDNLNEDKVQVTWNSHGAGSHRTEVIFTRLGTKEEPIRGLIVRNTVFRFESQSFEEESNRQPTLRELLDFSIAALNNLPLPLALEITTHTTDKLQALALEIGNQVLQAAKEE
ncbi:MAG: hypothetical protein ACXWLH_00515 [Candidatus Saccharimonadales bacterium]